MVWVKHCAIALSNLALYGRPDKQLEMTIHKMYCGSVGVRVGQCGCGSVDVGQSGGRVLFGSGKCGPNYVLLTKRGCGPDSGWLGVSHHEGVA